VIPDGVTAVIQRSGAFEGYWDAGFYPCLSWTNCKYLVSQQDFVYESPGNRVITRDNVQVDISLSILLKIKADESDTVQ
jgi:regulator of protease activity HflC (stomatin/prohibitin superfamily)